MNFIQRRTKKRRAQAELLILGALTFGEELTTREVKDRTGLTTWFYVAAYQLEASGKVTSRWADGPYPRRRLYRLARRHDQVTTTATGDTLGGLDA